MTSMSMGQNTVIAAAGVRAQLRWSRADETPDVDLCALVLNARGRVDSDADFVFYNQPVHPSELVRLMPKAAGRYPSQAIEMDLSGLPAQIGKIVLVCSADGASLSTVRDLHLVLFSMLDGRELARFNIRSNAETVLVAGEVYRRNSEWKFRAVGQGYSSGLSGLATDYGVRINDGEPVPDEASSRIPALTIDADAVQIELTSETTSGLKPIDLDLCALTFGADRRLVDVIWFLHPSEFDGHLTLTEGAGTSRCLQADLDALPGRVQHVLLTVSSMHGHALSDWPNLALRITDTNTDRQLVTLPSAESTSSSILGALSRTRTGWRWITFSRPANARSGRDLVTVASRALASVD
jgi:stress response protein SCP2